MIGISFRELCMLTFEHRTVDGAVKVGGPGGVEYPNAWLATPEQN